MRGKKTIKTDTYQSSEKLEPEQGKGSTFYFTLPFDEQKTIGIPIRNEVEKVINSMEKSILNVEDDKSSYIFLEIVLNKLGMNTNWAINAKESIEICKENPGIDLVLMDINMPGMSGYEATYKIKKMN